MKKITILITALFITISISSSVAQTLMANVGNPKKLGDKYYGEFAYESALKQYQKAYDEKDSSTYPLRIKIADTYTKLNDAPNAATWYQLSFMVPDTATQKAEHYLRYAESLSSIKEYNKAKAYYLKYDSIIAKESRTQNRIKGIDNNQVFYRKVASMSVQKEAFNSDETDFSPAFYKNTIVFVSSRKGIKAIAPQYSWDNEDYLDLVELDSSGQIKPFYKVINTRYHEGPVVFYDNESKMILTRNHSKKNTLIKDKEGVVRLRLYSSEKDKDGEWTPAKPLSINLDNYSVGHPTLMNNGKTLIFASDMPGGYGGVDLYRSDWLNDDWQTPVNLGPVINTEGNEMFPFIFKDKELFFTSNGHPGLGGLDIFGTNISDGIGNNQVVNVGAPINSHSDDFGIIVKDDALSGYFSTNREKGKSFDDIYAFQSNIPLISSFRLKGLVTDSESRELLNDVELMMVINNRDTLNQMLTDLDGDYLFLVEPNNRYKVIATKKGYTPAQVEVITLDDGTETWEKNIVMEKIHEFVLQGIILDGKTGEPIDSVHVHMLDNMSGEVALDFVSTGGGNFEYLLPGRKLNDRISFQIKLEKAGYLGKTVIFNKKLEKPGIVNLNEELNIKLDKIDVGVDIGKLIDMKPIYFDLGKAIIRKDAEHELDKIVLIMRENPTMKIELGSHTDARGDATSNFKLSDKRAKASAKYIVSQGIDATRITGKGYGESVLINKCGDGVKCSEEEHQLNRRTEFKVVEF